MGTPTRRTRLPTHVSDSLPKLAKPTQPLECYWTQEPTNNPPSQNTPTHTKETCMACCLCCTGQTDGMHRSDRWTGPVRPVATAAAQQVFQRASVTSLGHRKKHSQNTTCMEGKPYTKPSKTTPNRQRTDQQHHDPKPHESSSSPEANPTSDLHRSDRSRTPCRCFRPATYYGEYPK
jgi:hypothetical protein